MSLELKNISSVVNGETHIDKVNISFAPGSFNVLLGRTLSGKTSLMRLIAGLDKPTTGNVLMNGVDVTGVPVQKRNISMVYQQFINYPNLTVFENIASPLRIVGEPESIIQSKVSEIASMLHIEQFLNSLPLELSGGQQQRTAMARALVKDSGLILFDEPLVNLDYKLREELRFELRELFKIRKTIAIYATTEPNEALALGGVTTLLHEGRVIQSGKVNDVYNLPSSIESAELFSEPPINIIQGSLNDGKVIFSGGVSVRFNKLLRNTNSGNFQFGIRPHHIRLSQQNNDDIVFDLTVDVAEISGSETFLHMLNDDQSIVAQLSGVHYFKSGTPVKIYVPMHKLFVFDINGKMIQTPHDVAFDLNNKNEVISNG
jgi:glycerol transport system ATP-binding protein